MSIMEHQQLLKDEIRLWWSHLPYTDRQHILNEAHKAGLLTSYKHHRDIIYIVPKSILYGLYKTLMYLGAIKETT